MKLYDYFFGPKQTPEASEEGEKSHEEVTSPWGMAYPPGQTMQACDLLVGPTDVIPPP